MFVKFDIDEYSEDSIVINTDQITAIRFNLIRSSIDSGEYVPTHLEVNLFLSSSHVPIKIPLDVYWKLAQIIDPIDIKGLDSDYLS